jgi:hypothetical protein
MLPCGFGSPFSLSKLKGFDCASENLKNKKKKPGREREKNKKQKEGIKTRG